MNAEQQNCFNLSSASLRLGASAVTIAFGLDNMLIVERQSRLQELIARRGMADLETLSAELNVSQSTIRRDIEQLESRGLVRRTHGGVVWAGPASAQGVPGPRPYAFDQRMGYQVDAKRAIARAAASLVAPGETVLLDGGTTTYFLAEQLLDRPLQLVTNSLPIADLFLNNDQVELIVVGGLLYPRYGVLLGPTAENALAAIHARSLFMSVAGVLQGTLYNQNLLLVQAEQQMMRQAQQVVLLVDSGKFGQQALVKLCPLEDVDIVVTNDTISPADRAMIEAAGCELVLT